MSKFVIDANAELSEAIRLRAQKEGRNLVLERHEWLASYLASRPKNAAG